jgi:3,4-dihydroxy 2-butanone 4-phosphate synthase / GTP cyclohydrolase II
MIGSEVYDRTRERVSELDLESASVESAVEVIGRGGMAVIVDDPGRENEGDLVMAARFATQSSMNFMATNGRGLICAPMSRDRLGELRIPPMVDPACDPHKTAFHVGVDLRGQATGISARERAETARALGQPQSSADDFTRPGHVFPLAARPGGVLERPGHTEASVDLVEMAGAGTAAVICEIMADDGEMMRLPELSSFARRHGLPLVTIPQMIQYCRGHRIVRRVSQARVPLKQGAFTVVGYLDLVDGREHLAAIYGDVAGRTGVLTRVHSECLTGDVLGSTRCDCGWQLEDALRMIVAEGAGVLVYVRGHEGRGIGLLEKLRAYRLQDMGLDTVDANLALGHPPDARDYAAAAQILADIGIAELRLLTNNPDKRAGLERHGVSVLTTVPLATEPNPENIRYLSTKRERMGHLLDADALAAAVKMTTSSDAL